MMAHPREQDVVWFAHFTVEPIATNFHFVSVMYSAAGATDAVAAEIRSRSFCAAVTI
jgi:hypothetical protein